MIEQRAFAAVDQGEAVAGFVDAEQAGENGLAGFPLPPGCGRRRGRQGKTVLPKGGFDLGCNNVQPFDAVQVVVVGRAFFGGTALFGEFGLAPAGAVGGGGEAGGFDAGIAGGQIVVVGADQDLAGAVFFGEVGNHRHDRSGIEGDGNGQAGGHVQAGGGGVAFGDEDQAAGYAADQVVGADFVHAGWPILLFELVAALGAPNDLQADDTAIALHGDGQGAVAGWRVAQAEGMDALALEVVGLAGRHVEAPAALGFLGGFLGFGSAQGLGPLGLGFEAGAHGVALGRAE